jgi:hypothetical protein
MEILYPNVSTTHLPWLREIDVNYDAIPEGSVNPQLLYALDGETFENLAQELDVGQTKSKFVIPQLVSATIIFAIYSDVEESPVQQCVSPEITIDSAEITTVMADTYACGKNVTLEFDLPVIGCYLALSLDSGSTYGSALVSFTENVSQYKLSIPIIPPEATCKIGLFLTEDSSLVFETKDFAITIIPENMYLRPNGAIDPSWSSRSAYHIDDASNSDANGNLLYFTRAIYINTAGDYYIKAIEDTEFHKHSFEKGANPVSIKAICVMGEGGLAPIRTVDLVKTWH